MNEDLRIRLYAGTLEQGNAYRQQIRAMYNGYSPETQQFPETKVMICCPEKKRANIFMQ